jgi:hypothetical protein
MNAQAVKLELIKQIADIQNEQVLEQLSALLKRAGKEGGKPNMPPALSAAESELLFKINEGLPHDLQLRYAELTIKAANEDLLDTEHEELLKLIPLVEAKAVERLEYLIQLAGLWNISVDEVMTKLGIHPPSFVYG